MDRRSTPQDGYSLVELLVVIGIFTVIGSITLGIMLSAFRTQRTQVDHVDALNRAKVAIERVTRDVRGANPIDVAEDDAIEITLVEGGASSTRAWVLETVSGSRNLYRCTSTLATCSSATGQLVASGLSADVGYQLFTYLDTDGNALVGFPLTTSDRESVTDVVVTLRVPRAQGADPVELSNSIRLRNARD